MKHTRRLLSLLLVLALALAISPSAFAEAGDLTAELGSNGTLSFSNLKTTLRNLVPDANYVTGLSVAPAQGTLYQGYVSEADPGAGVATSQMFYLNVTGYNSIDSVTFVPNPNFIGDAEISYNVVGTKNLNGKITVKVGQQQQQQTSAIPYSSSGNPIRFQADDFNDWCQKINGRSIHYVTFTLPSARYGTMYYDYIDENTYDGLVTAGTQYFRVGSLDVIDKITFIPAEDYSGTFSISFSGVDTAGISVRGQVRISIAGGAPSSGSDLTYSVTAGQRLTFRTADFSNACYYETGYELKYIRFTRLPDSSRGTLYYNTTAVNSTTYEYSYSGGTRQLENVSFLADSGYDGTVTIPYTGYSTQNTSFSGTITIDITGNDSVIFPYTVKAGYRVYIRVGEISDACYEQTGAQLSYVMFPTKPASSYGALYHNASSVSVSDRYYISANTNLLENVNFLANEYYEGTFSIPFTAYSSRGDSFNGALRMEVTDAGASAIRYTVVAGQRIELRVDDFADTCSRKTGYPLNYVQFTSLPAATSGMFYENGSTAVSRYMNYYRSGNANAHLLENISFVANANYSGTFSVAYTCYSSGGGSFTGTFPITVTAVSASQTSLITYYSTGPAARFSASDFSSATSLSLSDTLAGARFTAPDESAGKMYYAYTSPASRSSFVPGQSYSTALLSQIYFLPRAGYSGTVDISYTATDNSGNTASGTVRIVVTPPLVSSWFDDMGRSSWAVPAVDFLRTYQVVSGVSAAQYAPTANLRRGDFILMLSRAYGFSSAGTASFPDVPQNSYYATAIAAARTMGIVTGDASGLFHPNNPISRQDAAVMLHRCMRLNGQNLTGTESALFGFPDSGSIASYAVDAMAALVRFGVFQGDERGLLRPTASLTRAEMATILYKAVTY